MALDASRATTDAINRLRAKLLARGFNAPAGYGPRDDLFAAIVEAVIEEIKTHAVVNATATGVSTGVGTAPVSGGID